MINNDLWLKLKNILLREYKFKKSKKPDSD